MNKNNPYPKNTFIATKSSMKKSTCQYRKVILVAKFTCTNQYKIFSKEMDYKGIHSYFIGFFNQPEKTCSQKNVIAMNGIAIQYTNILY